jgi:threonine/homoserine/homoserine lactone efflux protein
MQFLAPEVITLLTIGFAQLLAVVSPGPSFLITAQTAVAGSRWDGVKVALGLGAGTVIWSTAAVFGLSALFHAYPMLYLALRIAGVLFLLFIAWQIFSNATTPLRISAQASTGRSPFVKGFLVQISNPKVAVFFGTIFVAIAPSNPSLLLMLALIAVFTFNEVWWYSLVAIFFGVGPVRSFYLRAKTWIDRVTGLFLGTLGLRLLWNIVRE